MNQPNYQLLGQRKLPGGQVIQQFWKYNVLIQGKKTYPWYFMTMPPTGPNGRACNLLPVIKDKNGQKSVLLMLFQRGVLGRNIYSIELPGGVLDPGENLEKGALRELREETRWTTTKRPVFNLRAIAPDAGLLRLQTAVGYVEIDESQDKQIKEDGRDAAEQTTIKRLLRVPLKTFMNPKAFESYLDRYFKNHLPNSRYIISGTVSRARESLPQKRLCTLA